MLPGKGRVNASIIHPQTSLKKIVLAQVRLACTAAPETTLLNSVGSSWLAYWLIPVDTAQIKTTAMHCTENMRTTVLQCSYL